ncbi:DNA-3-methyladenine glycosylase 2 family protein [Candidatus Saccharibacteria bacterium]|nr:DNA-3-methyladenine glycosylase 2 family protein [Candidatus Saccharibacteria bacterium]HPR09140.1 DNA-3-methyladenine glycosylase [Candidatus Saccharibacteria bacterium]
MQFSKAERKLCGLDPVLGTAIRHNGPIAYAPHDDYFAALASSIISQQLSVKAAATIYSRFKSHTKLLPVSAVQLDESECKAIGLSGQKARYIHDLAEHFVRDSAVFNQLESLTDDMVIAELTKVKGIGVWTAQMFLLFTLQRPDVFAIDDLGLQNAIAKLYNLASRPSRTEMMAFAEKWRPYRSTACYHLWHLLDTKPTT